MTSRPLLYRPERMSEEDAELMEAARELLSRVYKNGRHEVVTAFRMADGAIVMGVHVDGSARRSAVCAEGAAAGAAIAYASGAAVGVIALVSVLRRSVGTWHVIEPCGVCAELLSDYWPDARVWVGSGEGIVSSSVGSLLPAKLDRIW